MIVDIPGSKFGHITGIPVGTRWASRKAMSEDHVHPPLVAGIYGRKKDGARSVVIGGGTFDDVDHGDTFEYIGSGGRAPGERFGDQTEDQTFDNNLNKALLISAKTGRPVRVCRGAGKNTRSRFAPYQGFRYDGLYTVTNARLEQVGNYKVCKFDFTRCPGQPPLPEYEGPLSARDDITIRHAKFKAVRRRIRAHVIRERRGQTIEARWEGSGEQPQPRTVASNAGNVASTSEIREQSPISYRSASPSTPTATSNSDSWEYADDIAEELGLDDSDDEDQEDIFAEVDKVFREFDPVSGLVEELRIAGNTKETQRRRKELIVELGNHIYSVLQRKKAYDSSRANYEQWKEWLWYYVASNLPPGHDGNMFEPVNLDRIYRKYRGRRTVSRAAKQDR